MAYSEKDLLDNHLAFLVSHRGDVRQAGGLLFIDSEKPEFTYAVLGTNSRMDDLTRATQRVQVLPSARVSEADLSRLGFSKIFGLSYMVLDTRPAWRPFRGELKIEEVKGRATVMDDFSHTQARGFSETSSDYQTWHPFLKAANDRNLKNPKQHFYVGYLDDEPVGTVLTVEDEKTAGIYAVATLAHQRKKGISTAIMAQAVREADTEKGITLQVKQDSYVEEFYRNLGFQRFFASGVYRRNS